MNRNQSGSEPFIIEIGEIRERQENQMSESRLSSQHNSVHRCVIQSFRVEKEKKRREWRIITDRTKKTEKEFDLTISTGRKGKGT